MKIAIDSHVNLCTCIASESAHRYNYGHIVACQGVSTMKRSLLILSTAGVLVLGLSVPVLGNQGHTSREFTETTVTTETNTSVSMGRSGREPPNANAAASRGTSTQTETTTTTTTTTTTVSGPPGQVNNMEDANSSCNNCSSTSETTTETSTETSVSGPGNSNH